MRTPGLAHGDASRHLGVDGALIVDRPGIAEGDEELVAGTAQARIEASVLRRHRVLDALIGPVPLHRVSLLDGNGLRLKRPDRVRVRYELDRLGGRPGGRATFRGTRIVAC